jgi:hypothetical protein
LKLLSYLMQGVKKNGSVRCAVKPVEIRGE